MYAPKYSQKKWTRSKYIKRSHNCYSYFLNKVNKKITNACKKTLKKHKKCTMPQPGLVKKYKSNPDRSLTCKALHRRIKADNKMIFKTTAKRRCPKHYYKGALAVNKHRTYHFYRQDRSGYWSHKDGPKKPTIYDRSGNRIKDPRKADRNYKEDKYPRFCSYYCVPSSASRKKQNIRNKKWSRLQFSRSR